MSYAERTYIYTGFTSESRALQVIIREINQKEDVELEVLAVRKPDVKDIIRKFCRYCH